MKLFLPLVLLLLAACGDASHGTGSASDAGDTDAASEEDAAAAPEDVSAAPEGGTVLGPCGSEMSCPTGALCVYPEANCSATAVCVEVLATECGKQTQLTGCDGGIVYTRGCAVGGAYATGPTPPFALSDGGT